MKNKKVKNTKDNKLSNVVSAYNKFNHKWLLVVAFILLCLIITALFLYKPAKDYYITVRENDKLEAQLEALKHTNQSLNDDIKSLKTEEGIKQRASESLGLIQKGESIGIVSGTGHGSDGTRDSAESTSSKLSYKNIKTPHKWYTAFCDAIFGIHD